MIVGKGTNNLIISENTYADTEDELIVISNNKQKNKKIIEPNLLNSKKTILFDGDGIYKGKQMEDMIMIDFDEFFTYDPFRNIKTQDDISFLCRFILHPLKFKTHYDKKLFEKALVSLLMATMEIPLYLGEYEMSISGVVNILKDARLSYKKIEMTRLDSIVYNWIEFDGTKRGLEHDNFQKAFSGFLKFKCCPEKIQQEVVSQLLDYFTILQSLPIFSSEKKSIKLDDFLWSDKNVIVTYPDKKTQSVIKICDIMVCQIIARSNLSSTYKLMISGIDRRSPFYDTIVSEIRSRILDVDNINIIMSGLDNNEHHSFLERMMLSTHDRISFLCFLSSIKQTDNCVSSPFINKMLTKQTIVYLGTDDEDTKKYFLEHTPKMSIDDFEPTDNILIFAKQSPEEKDYDYDAYIKKLKSVKDSPDMIFFTGSISKTINFDLIVDEPYINNSTLTLKKDIKSLMSNISDNLKTTNKKNSDASKWNL